MSRTEGDSEDASPIEQLKEDADLRDAWVVDEEDSDKLVVNYRAVPVSRLNRRFSPGVDVTYTGTMWMLASHDSIARGFDRDHQGILARGKTIDCQHLDDAVVAFEHAMERVEESVGEELRDAHTPTALPDGGQVTTREETDDRRVLRIDCKVGGRDIMREVLEYRVGPAADWTFVRGTLVLAGRSERVDEDLKRQLMSATHDLQMEYSGDAIYDAAEDADRLESEISRTEIETWGEATVDVAAVPPRELSLDELRDEYWAYIPTLRSGRRERPPANYPALLRRAVAVWTAIRERTDEQPPECSSCGGQNWTPAFVEPVECAECGTTVHSRGRRANQDLVEAVFDAWRAMIAAEERDADE